MAGTGKYNKHYPKDWRLHLRGLRLAPLQGLD